MILALVGKSSGKTTTAVNVAAALSQYGKRGRRVRLVNADPQGSASEWAAQRTEAPIFDVVDHVAPTIYSELPQLTAGVDDLVIDAPAGTGRATAMVDERIQITRAAIFAALSDARGVVVVPVTPSPWDLWAGVDLRAVIKEVQKQKGMAPRADQRAVLLLNRVAPSDPRRPHKIVTAARERLAAGPLPLLSTVIHQRTDYVTAPVLGLSVTEYAPHSAAADEVRALTAELLKLTGEIKK